MVLTVLLVCSLVTVVAGVADCVFFMNRNV